MIYEQLSVCPHHTKKQPEIVFQKRLEFSFFYAHKKIYENR